MSRRSKFSKTNHENASIALGVSPPLEIPRSYPFSPRIIPLLAVYTDHYTDCTIINIPQFLPFTTKRRKEGKKRNTKIIDDKFQLLLQ